MELNFQHNTKKSERTSATTSVIPKICKYNSIIEVLQLEFNTDSQQECETILSNIDIDYYDPKEYSCTPLCYAVKNNLEDWSKFLLEHGASPALATVITDDGSKKTVADVAWSNESYKTVLQILFHDGPFPQEFDVDKLSGLTKSRIRLFVETAQNLHVQIEESNHELVFDFVENNPRFIHVYNANNQCALTTALKSKNFNIYAYLRSKRFSKGIDVNHDLVMKSLRKGERTELDTKLQKYFLSPDFHVLDLLSKSRLGLSNDSKNFDKVKRYFELLNLIDEIRPILELVASIELVTISFDFNSEDIANLDPTRCFTNNISSVRGRTYINKILISAKRDLESEILGTLAHEMTHFVLQVVYNNKFLPYIANDEARRKKYFHVVGYCKRIRNQEEVIRNAFKYNVETELIVRVPQLYALYYKSEKFYEIYNTFKRLFIFFNQYVLKDIIREVTKIEPKKEILRLNNTFGLLQKLKTVKICLKNTKHCKITTSGHVFVESCLTQLFLANLLQKCILKESETIFVDLKKLSPQNYANFFHDLSCLSFVSSICILDSGKVEIEQVEFILKNIIGRKREVHESTVLFVSKRIFPRFGKLFTKQIKIDYKWNDLDSNSQYELLDSKIFFQGVAVHLKDIFDGNLEAIKEVPLETFLDSTKPKSLKVEIPIPKLEKILLPRFFQEANDEINLSSEEVIIKLETNNTVIISDVAGMGKTTSAKNFANSLKIKHASSCVVFTDLKLHIQLFEKYINDNLNKEFNLVHIMAKILGFTNKIEEKALTFLIANGRIIFIVDGFDEISPKYKEFVLKILERVEASQNLLMVTTRNHLKDELEMKFGTKAIKLMPFTECNQTEFLTKLLMRKSKKGVQNEEEAAQSIKKFKNTLPQSISYTF